MQLYPIPEDAIADAVDTLKQIWRLLKNNPYDKS
jgi:hypothetical protein